LRAFEGNADSRCRATSAGQVYYLALNQKKEELANPKVQEAMRWAIDYQA
jgi:peptide/nickel transport system substrate-binding protein